MAKPPEKPETEARDVERHDEVYFRHASGPKAGRVLSRGKHGCIIEADGRRHKVKWDGLLGHRVRVQADMKVIDQGEDGMIVASADGRRRYVHDPVPSEPRGGEVMHKSLTPAVLFFAPRADLVKAIANRPGLTLQDVTDRAGNQTKRWKRTTAPVKAERKAAAPKPAGGEHHAPAAPAADKPKRGAKIVFAVGGLKGRGEVVGTPGEHGAHVRDESGHEHKVLYSQMDTAHDGVAEASGPAKPDYAPRHDGEEDKAYAKRVVDKLDAPDSLPEEHDRFFNTDGAAVLSLDQLVSAKTDEENAQGGSNGPKRMLAAYHEVLGKRDPIKVTMNEDGKYTIVDGNGTFTSVKKLGWKGVPAWVVQPHETEEEIFAAAKDATEHLAKWLNRGSGVADKLGYKTFEGVQPPAEAWDQPGGFLMLAPMKGAKRSAEKVAGDYGGDWSRLKDVTRCTLVVDTIDQVKSVMDRLHAEGMVVAQPVKDRYGGKPTGEGYRDVNYVIRFPNGHLGELQINTKTMMKAKDEGHPHYEISRALTAKHGTRPPTEWPDADNTAYWDAINEQKRIYGEAYKKLQPGPSA